MSRCFLIYQPTARCNSLLIRRNIVKQFFSEIYFRLASLCLFCRIGFQPGPTDFQNRQCRCCVGHESVDHSRPYSCHNAGSLFDSCCDPYRQPYLSQLCYRGSNHPLLAIPMKRVAVLIDVVTNDIAYRAANILFAYCRSTCFRRIYRMRKADPYNCAVKLVPQTGCFA